MPSGVISLKTKDRTQISDRTPHQTPKGIFGRSFSEFLAIVWFRQPVSWFPQAFLYLQKYFGSRGRPLIAKLLVAYIPAFV